VQLYSMVFSVHQDVSLATCPRCVAECCRYWLYLIIADTDYIWLYWLNGRSFTNDPWWYPVPICFVYELMVCVSFLLQGKAQAQYEAGKAVQEQMSEILYIYNIYIFTLIIYHYILIIETRGLKVKSQSRWFLNMPKTAPRLWLSNDFPSFSGTFWLEYACLWWSGTSKKHNILCYYDQFSCGVALIEVSTIVDWRCLRSLGEPWVG
jgi:hypothetical protein